MLQIIADDYAQIGVICGRPQFFFLNYLINTTFPEISFPFPAMSLYT